MSIDGMMRTSISGMGAQSSKLGAVANNIANAATIGYKRVEAQFSTLLPESGNGLAPAGVDAAMRNRISSQGILQGTSSKYDLAISGEGFMLVSDSSGSVALTRAGGFVFNESGELINAGGFKLLGFPANGGDASAIAVNGTAGLEPISLRGTRLEATATSASLLASNLPADAGPVAAADLPSANAATSTGSARTSIVVYGSLGEEKTLDVYFARTSTVGEWEVSVFDAAGRSAAGGFPYAGAALSSTNVVFDASGQLATSSATSLTIPVPGGAGMELDLAQSTQLAAKFVVLDVQTNGNPASNSTNFDIASDGTIYQVYENGQRNAVYRVPLATVASPDRLTQKSGNTFESSSGSGDIRVGLPRAGGLGSLVSGALENSTVDMASELTDMISAQRSYTANSRVFQTGAEIMEVIVNLKR